MLQSPPECDTGTAVGQVGIESEAWRETIAKSRRGLMAFPAALVLVGSLAGTLSTVFVSCALVLVATTVLRAVIVQRLVQRHGVPSRLERRLFSASVVGSGATWGLLSAWLTHLDPFSPAAILSVLITVAVMGQSIVIYTASFALTATQQVALALPHAALWSRDMLTQADGGDAYFTLGAVIYCAYCLVAARGLAREQFVRLARARELQVAREQLEDELVRRSEIQKQITDELRERELDYQRIYQQAHDAILIFEPHTEIVLEANERASEIYGFALDELIGMSLLEVSLDPERGKKKVDETLEKGHFLAFATRQRRKDGQLIELEINASVIEYRGELAILSINRDVTDRNRAEGLRLAKEAAERASRTKSLFLANMSHEIRTPMAGMIGLANLLREADLPAREATWARTLHASAESLLLILDDVLDLSKIEDDRLELVAEPFDLETEILRVVELTRSGVEAHGLELHTELDNSLPRRLVGDAGRLRQVLLNLVGNAVKFTPRGVVAVSVAEIDRESVTEIEAEIETDSQTDTETDTETCWLAITVRDSGIGIEAESLERIFEPFTQGDAEINRRYGGTGLGLTICRHLVTLMGGTIDVVSAPGEGSSFRVVVPFGRTTRRSADADADENADTGDAGAPEVQVRGRVLLAEDNEVNRMVALATLQRLGVDAEAVADGREALQALEGAPFDLVLMDLQMPALDGLEATRQLREREAGTGRHVPVVALTAHAFESDRQRCLDAGMNDYLAKPVRLHELAAMLRRWLEPARAPADEATTSDT